MAEFGENSGRQAEEHDGTNSRGVPEPVCGTGDPAVTVPPVPWSSNHNQRKKLVLHVDLNNTILVSDAVTGQGSVAALDHFISTVTWGKMSKHGKPEIDNVSTFPHHNNARDVSVLSRLMQRSHCPRAVTTTRQISFKKHENQKSSFFASPGQKQ